MEAKDPSTSFAELICDAFKVLGSKSAPGIINSGKDLNTLQLVALFKEWSQISIKQVMLAVQVRKQLITLLPLFEWHQRAIKLIFVQLYDAPRMVEDVVVIRPEAHSLGV